MKKFISTTLLLILIAFISSSYAQKKVDAPSDRSTDPEFRKVQFGLGLGLNITSLIADWGLATYIHPGVNFGTYLKLRFSKVIALQPGIQISIQGQTFEYDVRLDVTYLQVPIVLKIYAVKGLNFDFGPQIGILAIAKVYDPDEPDEAEDMMDYFTPIDIALRAGINYEFKFGLCITTHYNIGLTNINDADDRTELPIRNGVFQLGVGFYF